MSNDYWPAVNTRNAVKASRPNPGETVVPVEPDPPPAPGTTTHHCQPPEQPTVNHNYLGPTRWTCPACHQTWEADWRQDTGPFHDVRVWWTAIGPPPKAL